MDRATRHRYIQAALLIEQEGTPDDVVRFAVWAGRMLHQAACEEMGHTGFPRVPGTWICEECDLEVTIPELEPPKGVSP